ncbi:hypothetical protein BG011_008154 [Mortierella polycephala]|uniref:Uncharacterized protein n=1 Tax=Mortierella polycephala TaxID=41804 RepID=A0A9P6PQ81_9FUNG|nr:hypothetical protein BG011_008154 [Mortierella polycephala]
MTDPLQHTSTHPVDLGQDDSTDPASAKIAHAAQLKDSNNPSPSINICNEHGVVNTRMAETMASTATRQDSHPPHNHDHDDNNNNSGSIDTASSDSDSVSNCSSRNATISCNHEPTAEKHEDLLTTMSATMCPETSSSPNVPNDSSVDPVDRPTAPSSPPPRFDTEQQQQHHHHNHPSIDTIDNKDTTTTTTNINTVHCSPYSAPIDSHMVSNSSSFLPSSSSSSLSDYLIIGQEQVERDDSEFDRHSERSYSRSSTPLSSSNENYGTDMSEAGQDSQTEDLQQQRLHRFATAKHSRLHRSSARQQQQQQQSPSHQSHPSRQSGTSQEISEEQFLQDRREQQQRQRITHTSTLSAESLDSSSSSSTSSSTSTSKPQPTSRPTSPTNDKARKRRSYKPTANEAPSTSTPSEPTATATETATSSLPALKMPSIKGVSKSIFEFILASVVCVSLLSCMFALSYVSTGTTHLVGWYSDQRIGQRIRDGIKEREHLVQEALEKMAGEEYVKVKRRSRQQGTYSYQQYQQQQQQQQKQKQQQQQKNQPHQQHGHQNRYQQQYQQQREQRQRQEWERQQQQQKQDDEYERRRLSSAEWQELIRAASTSFLGKFTTASGPGDRRDHRR